MRRVAQGEGRLRLRPSTLPNYSCEQALDGAVRAWAQTSAGVDGREEWVHNACLNALDGSEDGQIARYLVPLWMNIDMPNTANMNMMRASRRPMLSNAGMAMTRENNRVLIPLAPLISRKILATFTTRTYK